MNNETLLKQLLISFFKNKNLDLKEDDIVIERCKEVIHGDYSTNSAMKYCKRVQMNPRDLANEISKSLASDQIEKIEVAGPGFVNFFMKKDALKSVVSKIISEGASYGRLPSKGKKINIEYVSANPTGDLHLGHTRCAAIGDAIANLLEWAGYDVTREYYVNDCGNQVEHLGHSIRARYHELFGEPLDLDDDDYHGLDLIDIAKSIKEEFGDKYLIDTQESHDFFIRYGIDAE